MEEVRFDEESLAQVNVRILERQKPLLSCMYCGTSWSPGHTVLGTLPHGWWRCPQGCNSQGPWSEGNRIADESEAGERVGSP